MGALCSVSDPLGNTSTFAYTKAPLGPDRVLSVTDRRANASGGKSSTTGSETLYTYNDSANYVTADTAAPATFGSASPATGCAGNAACERNRYLGIDNAGRVGEVDQGNAADQYLHQEAYFWDGDAIPTCEQPDGAVDNDLCETITRAVPSSAAFTVNGVGTGTVNGVTVADQGVGYRYDELGELVSTTKIVNPAGGWNAADAEVTTYGNHQQYMESNGGVHAFDDLVLGGGRVESSSAAGTSSYESTVQADHPSAYYQLDNLTGTTATDSSGNGQDALEGAGTVLDQVGAVPGNTAIGEPGNNTWALTVNALSGFANGTGSSSAFSVESWQKSTNTGIDYTLCSPCSSTGMVLGRYTGGRPWV
ncbi:MAG: hypothetical protein J0H43_10510, partial [Actinobacteria bacterium]|nr:hypothetical protein [Actinomycetota bacterium]